MGDGRLAALVHGQGAIAGRPGADPGQGPIDQAALGPGVTCHLGPIGLVDRAGRKQATELAVDPWGEGQQQQARGVAIEPVHQAQLRPALLDPGDEGIGQVRPQTGLAQKPRGLVKGRQIGV